MLSIKFTKKERSVDQLIDRATSGPSSVTFICRDEGKERMLGLQKPCLQTLIGSLKDGVNESIPCNGEPNTNQPIIARETAIASNSTS